MVKPKATSKKTKNCSRGFTCGRSCISKAKICRSNVGADGKKIAESFADFVKRVAAEEAEKQGQGSAAAPKEQLPSIPRAQMDKEREIRETSRSSVERNKALDELYRENYELVAGSEVNRGRWSRAKEKSDLDLSSYDSRVLDGSANATADELRKKYTNNQPTRDVPNDYVVEYNLDSFAFDTKDLINELTESGSGKMLPETEEIINRIGNGTQMVVAWNWEDNNIDRSAARLAAGEDIDGRDALRIALGARRLWKDEILPSIPPGTIIMNTPLDGPRGARASGYRRQGFGDASPANNHQYGIVNEQGELVPLQVAMLDPDDTSKTLDNRGMIPGGGDLDDLFDIGNFEDEAEGLANLLG